MPALQNQAMLSFDKVLQHAEDKHGDLSLLKFIYDSTSEGSALRQYVLHTIITTLSGQFILDNPGLITEEMVLYAVRFREKHGASSKMGLPYMIEDFEVSVEDGK